MVNIRKAILDDSRELANLMAQLGYTTSPEEMQERLLVILHRLDYNTWVAEYSGAVVGMVGVYVEYSYEQNGPYGRLMALVVDEAWRGRGIGECLVREAESWLQEAGAHFVTLTSGRQREAAHRFYTRLGYAETGLRFYKKL